MSAVLDPAKTDPPVDPKIIEDVNSKISKAKISIMDRKDSAFISTVCFSLEHELDSSVSTACTNGKYIKYNPEFMHNLPHEQWEFVLVHETWHVALQHVDGIRFKTGYDNKDLLNIAMDYVINNMLDTAGYSMPDWVCMDHKYDNMTVEQVYKLLEKENPNQKSKMKDVIPFDGTAAEVEKQKMDIENILIKAALNAELNNESIGNLPSSLQMYLEELRNPKLPWNVILSRYFTRLQKNDYSFRRPNRRFLPDHILPAPYSEALGDVAFVIDMSGSVSDSEINQFVSDVYSVLKRVKLASLKLVQFDTRIISVNEIKNTEQLRKIKFRGRGGTYVFPVLKWAKENKPEVLVIFSDGHFEIPDVKLNPNMPVLWIIHNNKRFKAPFGKVIHYEI